MALVCRILHLSDIHYGELKKVKDFKHRFRKLDPNTKEEEDTNELVEKCIDAVKKYINQDVGLDKEKPIFIVITGDLVCEGSIEKQFETAFKNISILKSQFDDIFLVPGNHDINRGAKGVSPLKHYIDKFHNKIFEKDQMRMLPPDFGSDNKFIKATGQTWQHPIPIGGKSITFIPLYSTITTSDQLTNPYTGTLVKDENSSSIARLLLPKKDDWLYDRGLITDEQWESVCDELSKVDNDKNNLKIAIFHHNPIPLSRHFIDPVKNEWTKVDAFPYPELNLLSNGPEILQLLAEAGVNLLLHGHRHQDVIATSFPWHRLVIVGAPSAGLDNNALKLRLGKDKILHVPKEWQGFNLIDVFNTEIGFSISVNTFKYYANDKKYIPDSPLHEKEKEPKIPLYIEPKFPFSPLSDSEGVRSAIEHIVRSLGGTTSLHYTLQANWDDGSVSDAQRDNDSLEIDAAYTPLSRIFNAINSDIDITIYFLKYITNKIDITKKEIELYKSYLLESIRRGFIIPDLKNAMMKMDFLIPWDKLLNPNNVETPNKFFKYLSDLLRQKERWIIYALEIIKLIDDEKYKLNRCIYFWPSKNNDPNPHTAECTKRKFKWLLHSLLTYRGLENVNIAWIPLAIEGADDQTVLCMEPHTHFNSNPSILLGFGANFDEKREDRISVFRMTAISENVDPGYNLCNNLRGMFTHLVHPLVRRMNETFPLMRKGLICHNNVKKLINTYGATESLQQTLKSFEINLNSDFVIDPVNEDELNDFTHWRGEDGNLDPDKPKKWIDRIEELFEWKDWGNPSEARRVPWKESDLSILRERLSEIE